MCSIIYLTRGHRRSACGRSWTDDNNEARVCSNGHAFILLMWGFDVYRPKDVSFVYFSFPPRVTVSHLKAPPLPSSPEKKTVKTSVFGCALKVMFQFHSIIMSFLLFVCLLLFLFVWFDHKIISPLELKTVRQDLFCLNTHLILVLSRALLFSFLFVYLIIWNKYSVYETSLSTFELLAKVLAAI